LPKPAPGETREEFFGRVAPWLIDTGAVRDFARARETLNTMYDEGRTSVARMASSRRFVGMTGVADTQHLRTATLHGRNHLVVPVVALVGDAVVRPMNSLGAEFVPASTLAETPSGWNGRPVVADHPDGGRSSANTPEALQRLSFGQMFNTRYLKGRLITEAWIDETRAREVGRDAIRVCERVKAKQMVEVSVGCFITPEERRGTSPSGHAYDFIWRSIVPDHLAMLPEGIAGACSIEMGCGAPRAARAHA